MVEVDFRRKSNLDVRPGPLSYPRLAPEEWAILVTKLRVLLKCMGIGSQVLDGWEKAPLERDTPMSSSGTLTTCLVQSTLTVSLFVGSVFGTSVKNSSPYASCQVVLGEHSHNLPICVFASVEEICQRGESRATRGWPHLT
jgi:hypothetical protein